MYRLKPLIGFLILQVLQNVYSKYFIIGPTRLTILKASDCPEYKNLPIRSAFVIHNFNKTYQLIDVSFSFPMDVDDTVGVSMKATRFDKNKKQQNAFVLDDNKACEVLNKYVGDMWVDLQRKSGMEPGVCPIKKGNYSVENVHLDLSKMKVQMFMEGNFSSKVTLKQHKKVILCKDFDVKLEPDK